MGKAETMIDPYLLRQTMLEDAMQNDGEGREMRGPVKATVAIGRCEEHSEIAGNAIQIQTPSGQFQIGIDNSGRTYLAATSNMLVSLALVPQSTNRALIFAVRDIPNPPVTS